MSASLRRATALLAIAALAAAELAAQAPLRLQLLGTLEPEPLFVELRAIDFEGDGRSDLLLVGEDGRLGAFGVGADGALAARGPWVALPQPRQSLLAIATFEQGSAREELVVAAPSGISRWRPREDGALAPHVESLARRAKFRLRTERPRFSPFVLDLDGDQRADLVLPQGWMCELWMREAGDGEARWKRQAEIPLELETEIALGTELLSDQLLASYRVPALDIQDLNGDGRKDLLVASGRKRAYHLQTAAGELPAKPDLELDLDTFRDTTPEGGLRLGRTLQGAKESQLDQRDLNGDGRPDHVIAHLRKIWVFHASERGPQFTEPAQILRVAEDVTWQEVVHLDDDRWPDLALMKVEVPTAAAILRGLFAEMAIAVKVLDYPGSEGGKFATLPRRSRDLVLRIPPLLGLLKDFTKYIQRLETEASRSRVSAEGDLDGDGAGDLAMVTEDGTALEIWLGVEKALPGRERMDAFFRRVLFEESDPEWTIERLLALFGDFLASRALELTKGRAPSLRYELRPTAELTTPELALLPLDAHPGAELVLSYRKIGSLGATVVDVLRLAKE
jgi:hypothetical protein